MDHQPEGHIEFQTQLFIQDKGVGMSVLRSGRETLGIIGQTGSGKTTIVNLLARLYDVNSGEVLLDGCNVKMWSCSG